MTVLTLQGGGAACKQLRPGYVETHVEHQMAPLHHWTFFQDVLDGFDQLLFTLITLMWHMNSIHLGSTEYALSQIVSHTAKALPHRSCVWCLGHLSLHCWTTLCSLSKDCCPEILRLIPSLAGFTQHFNRGSRHCSQAREKGLKGIQTGQEKVTLFIHGWYNLKRRKF